MVFFSFFLFHIRMWQLLQAHGAPAVYTDTVRHTPGRPEFVDAQSSTRLWLLPKKQMDEVLGTVNHAFRSRQQVNENDLARVLANW